MGQALALRRFVVDSAPLLLAERFGTRDYGRIYPTSCFTVRCGRVAGSRAFGASPQLGACTG